MSRIGKLPIEVPDGVKVGIEPGRLSVTGPKGELSVPVPDGVAAELEERTLRITCADASSAAMQPMPAAVTAWR